MSVFLLTLTGKEHDRNRVCTSPSRASDHLCRDGEETGKPSPESLNTHLWPVTEERQDPGELLESWDIPPFPSLSEKGRERRQRFPFSIRPDVSHRARSQPRAILKGTVPRREA